MVKHFKQEITYAGKQHYFLIIVDDDGDRTVVQTDESGITKDGTTLTFKTLSGTTKSIDVTPNNVTVSEGVEHNDTVMEMPIFKDKHLTFGGNSYNQLMAANSPNGMVVYNYKIYYSVRNYVLSYKVSDSSIISTYYGIITSIIGDEKAYSLYVSSNKIEKGSGTAYSNEKVYIMSDVKQTTLNDLNINTIGQTLATLLLNDEVSYTFDSFGIETKTDEDSDGYIIYDGSDWRYNNDTIDNVVYIFKPKSYKVVYGVAVTKHVVDFTINDVEKKVNYIMVTFDKSVDGKEGIPITRVMEYDLYANKSKYEDIKFQSTTITTASPFNLEGGLWFDFVKKAFINDDSVVSIFDIDEPMIQIHPFVLEEGHVVVSANGDTTFEEAAGICQDKIKMVYKSSIPTTYPILIKTSVFIVFLAVTTYFVV